MARELWIPMAVQLQREGEREAQRKMDELMKRRVPDAPEEAPDLPAPSDTAEADADADEGDSDGD
jgi:hypothetical protein